MRHRIKTGIVILTLFSLPLKVNATEIILDSEIEITMETETESETEVEVGTEAESETEVETSTETETESETEVIKPVELDLGEYSEKMIIGEKQLLSVTILPLDTTETTITYSSSNKKVASVNGMGRITALSLGKTSITVT